MLKAFALAEKLKLQPGELMQWGTATDYEIGNEAWNTGAFSGANGKIR